MVWYIVLAAAYGVYHFIFFFYSSYIFNYTEKKILLCLVSYIINLTFWIIYTHFFNLSYEALAGICFLLLLFVEFLVIFKLKVQIALYIAVTFALNLFAKRVIFVGAISLWQGNTPAIVMEDKIYFALVLILSCLLSSNTIAIARKSLAKICLDTILSDNKNIQFLTGIFLVEYISIILISSTMTAVGGGSNLLIYYIIIGLFTLLSFLIFIIYAYHLAKLRLVAQELKEAEEEKNEQLLALSKLKEVAATDHLTGMLTREEIFEKIVAAIKGKDMFFLAFLDIDGLKIVNDTYGHNEGDIYIRQVSQIITSYFSDSYIGRYGGDEIVVLGKYCNESDIIAKLVNCYRKVGKISANLEKDYQTSISYGLVFSQKDKNISEKEIIALSSKRMYEMKKLRQKHRGVTGTKK